MSQALEVILAVSLFILYASAYSSCNVPGCAEYMQKREELVQLQGQMRFDNGIQLNTKEQQVDAYLSAIRDQEINKNIANARFLLASNFREVKTVIEQSRLFPIFKAMPKGGILHVHGIGSLEFLVYNASYSPYCWMNIGTGSSRFQSGSFFFSNSSPPDCTGCSWARVNDLRSSFGNAKVFDEELLLNISFITPASSVSEDTMWEYFDNTIGKVSTLFSSDEMWHTFMIDSLRRLVEDKVTHVEIRGFVPAIRDDEGRSKYNSSQYLKLWSDLIQEFNSDLPEASKISLRFIYSVGRTQPPQVMMDKLMETVSLQASALGDLVVGFDIVDEEDRYFPLIYYLEDWLAINNYLSSQGLPNMKFYFHAGETTWSKRNSANLFDAILLNVSRIGHGFALHNNPMLMNLAKQKGIAVEVCPISNQMLRLLDDIRDHPAVGLMNSGVPVVLSNDDPLQFSNNELTYDFWAAYMSWNITLSSLKQLAINSISYSSLQDSVKSIKLGYLYNDWNKWIDMVSKQQV